MKHLKLVILLIILLISIFSKKYVPDARRYVQFARLPYCEQHSLLIKPCSVVKFINNSGFKIVLVEGQTKYGINFNMVVSMNSVSREIVISFGGPKSTDVEYFQQIYAYGMINVPELDNIQIEREFWNIYSTLHRHRLISLMQEFKQIEKVIIVGHSFGGSIALLSSYDLVHNSIIKKSPFVYTYAPLKIGTQKFIMFLQKFISVPIFRIKSRIDFFTMLPRCLFIASIKVWHCYKNYSQLVMTYPNFASYFIKFSPLIRNELLKKMPITVRTQQMNKLNNSFDNNFKNNNKINKTLHKKYINNFKTDSYNNKDLKLYKITQSNKFSKHNLKPTTYNNKNKGMNKIIPTHKFQYKHLLPVNTNLIGNKKNSVKKNTNNLLKVLKNNSHSSNLNSQIMTQNKSIPINNSSTSKKYKSQLNKDLKSHQIKLSQIKPSQIKLSQIKPSQIKLSQIKQSQIKPSQIKPNQSKPSQIKPTHIKPSQIKSSQIKSSNPNKNRLNLKSSIDSKYKSKILNSNKLPLKNHKKSFLQISSRFSNTKQKDIEKICSLGQHYISCKFEPIIHQVFYGINIESCDN